ncbi:MAG TPA: hypothetical protein VHM24_04875 [Gemmatimonadaceae bacterium]|nr:hypothetical protein [Gemmatimonadaceae bacterium]
MSDELRFPNLSERADRDAIGEPLETLIRDAYSPPVRGDQSGTYWAELEERIMSKVAAEAARDGGWFTVLAPWARTGLIAAAAVFALAGVIDRQLRDSESQLAYESVVEATTPDVVSTSEELLSIQNGFDGDGEAVSYFLSH